MGWVACATPTKSFNEAMFVLGNNKYFSECIIKFQYKSFYTPTVSHVRLVSCKLNLEDTSSLKTNSTIGIANLAICY